MWRRPSRPSALASGRCGSGGCRRGPPVLRHAEGLAAGLMLPPTPRLVFRRPRSKIRAGRVSSCVALLPLDGSWIVRRPIALADWAWHWGADAQPRQRGPARCDRAVLPVVLLATAGKCDSPTAGWWPAARAHPAARCATYDRRRVSRPRASPNLYIGNNDRPMARSAAHGARRRAVQRTDANELAGQGRAPTPGGVGLLTPALVDWASQACVALAEAQGPPLLECVRGWTPKARRATPTGRTGCAFSDTSRPGPRAGSRHLGHLVRARRCGCWRALAAYMVSVLPFFVLAAIAIRRASSSSPGRHREGPRFLASLPRPRAALGLAPVMAIVL